MEFEIKLPPGDDELHALLDGELDGAVADEVRRLVSLDPGLQARLDVLRAQREMLGTLHSQVLKEQVPAHLVRAAQKVQGRHGSARRWTQGLALAASLVMAFGLGWALRPLGLGPGNPSGSVIAAGPGKGAVDDAKPGLLAQHASFVKQAASAYAVYSPEIKHPVEVTAEQQEHLVQWLSKRLGRPLRLPQLGGLGYELVGGRLLPGDDGARALFMYQSKGGERVTLYLGSRPDALQAGTVEFKFSEDGSVPSFYWVDQGYSYALSGRMERGQLLNIAEAVYKQLD